MAEGSVITPSHDAAAPSRPAQWTKSRTVRFLLVAVAVVGLFLLNRSPSDGESRTQRSYEGWLEEIEKISPSSSDPAAAARNIAFRVSPPLALRAQGSPAAYEISDSLGSGKRDAIIRVLQLAREGKLFNRGDSRELEGGSIAAAESSTSDEFQFFISDGKRTFTSHLSNAELHESVQLRSLVKLMEIYSTAPGV